MGKIETMAYRLLGFCHCVSKLVFNIINHHPISRNAGMLFKEPIKR